MSPTIGDRYEGSDDSIPVKSPEIGKLSSGRVTAEAQSSSDKVSEGASEEQIADSKVLSFDEAPPEEVEGSYEADEKPERGRPRRQVQTPRKYRDFVMNSAKNRRIRTTSIEGMTRPRPEAMLRNENAVKRKPMQFRNEANARNESASVNKDAAAKSVRILRQTGIKMDQSEIAGTSQSTGVTHAGRTRARPRS